MAGKSRSTSKASAPLATDASLDFTRQRLAEAEAVIKTACTQLQNLERGAALKTIEAYLRPKTGAPAPGRMVGSDRA